MRRVTVADDQATFGRIVHDSYRALPGHPPDPDYDAELLDVAGRVEHGIVFGAFVDDRPAGCVSFVPGPGSFHAENLRVGESSFRMLGVESSSQRSGIGEALVRHCLDAAAQQGAAAVFIYSGDWMHAAHRLYPRLGFVRTPDRDWVFEDPQVRLYGFRHAL